ncbi:carbohydrate ABC transporter permease [Collimonas humicola]|uniref:carbohydrate ABC transporter permease n=1 Tax=Collimonas humicola TaxID=2825886 RepID=UPI001B8CA674|nr:carbohydrate ABC transporter permease [Collimonas humicola]
MAPISQPGGAAETARSRISRLAGRFNAMQAVSYLLLTLSSLFTVFFFGWVVLASFKKNRDLFKFPWRLPEAWSIDNFVKVWTTNQFGAYFSNSIVVVCLSVLILLIVATPAAYVLSRARFRGREGITNFFIVGMGIPVPLLFVPLFVTLSYIHLADTLSGLILVYIALSIPFTVFVLTSFFSSLPHELEDAAILDGCRDWQVFWHVMLPLAMPGVATVALLNFVWLWNEYQLSLVLINSPENRTLSLGLYSLINSMQYSGGDWAALFAGVTIVTVPTVVLYLFLSERMIGGMTMGGVK